MSEIFGILNITQDSFSDGGQFLNPEHAITQGQRLLQEGADWIDLSGQSSNSKASLVSEEEEWQRVSPVIIHFVKRGIRLSLDSFRPSVQLAGLKAGVKCLNDITGFTHPDSKIILQEELRKRPDTKLIVMHSHTLGIAEEKSDLNVKNVVPTILCFFYDRKEELLSWGVPESSVYFDPGMGFFLGSDPELSFEVLRQLDQIREEFPNLMVGVSRKSFLGNVLGGIPPMERENASLAAEIYLLQKQIPWIRTHNVLKLKHSEKIWKLIQKKEEPLRKYSPLMG